MQVRFLGAAREVTGSCFLVTAGRRQVLVECGLIQGSHERERRNADPFQFDPRQLDAVVLTHAHLDHSGRLPLLVREGFAGKVYTHRATADLCSILLQDSAYLMEKEAERDSRRRTSRHPVAPLYDRDDARAAQQSFRGLDYGQRLRLCEGVWLTLRDAGHILGSAIAELELDEDGRRRRLVVSGDLGQPGAPILRDAERVQQADLVLLESTYGDRLHRPWAATWEEIGQILREARAGGGNVLVPSFAVGRTQELLYAFSRHFEDWGLGDWQIFLDSPMAIEATEVYARHARIYDEQARQWFAANAEPYRLPNLRFTRTPEESMAINEVRTGAIIIAGSGMCSGGRITHHLRHHLGNPGTHVMIVGFQAIGTPGRALVDGAEVLRLFGEDFPVRARIHTVGGLSAHADQAALLGWYGAIPGRPPVALVHGEEKAMDALAARLREDFRAEVTIPAEGQAIEL
jgi:metallo-beta-lactamase family protein